VVHGASGADAVLLRAGILIPGAHRHLFTGNQIH
jgi:hypothetical protein